MTKFLCNVFTSMNGDRIVKALGRKHTSVVGVGLNTVTGLLLLASNAVQLDSIFLILAFLARAIQGVAMGFIQVSHYAIFSAIFPNKVKRC